MNCQEVKEHISSAVDKRLEREIKNAFETHIGQCPSCRNEFELERLTKKVLQTKLSRAVTPPVVSAKVLSRLGSLSEKEAGSRFLSGLIRLWEAPRWKPAVTLGVIALFAMILFVSLPLNIRHLHTSPDDNNVLHQTFNNYDAVVDGTLKPQVASSDPAEVKSFLAKTVNYEVKVPSMNKCQLMGGLVSNYRGKPLAHLVYQYDNSMVYVYQVDMQTVLEGKTLTIPSKAKEELLKTGWYVESPHPKCSLVMWVVDKTLCCAVADIDKSELIASLTYSNEEKQ